MLTGWKLVKHPRAMLSSALSHNRGRSFILVVFSGATQRSTVARSVLCAVHRLQMHREHSLSDIKTYFCSALCHQLCLVALIHLLLANEVELHEYRLLNRSKQCQLHVANEMQLWGYSIDQGQLDSGGYSHKITTIFQS